MQLCAAVFTEFFHRAYVWEQVLELANNYPDTRSLYIDYNDVCRFDLDMGNVLIEHPDTFIKVAEETLAGLDVPADIDKWHPYVRIKNFPESEKRRRRSIRECDERKLIAIDGIITQSSTTYPHIVNAAFKCRYCDELTWIPQVRGVFVEPFACDNCERKGQFKLDTLESVKEDTQDLRVCELPENLSSNEPGQDIEVLLRNDLAGTVRAGNRVSIVGVLRSYQKSTIKGKSAKLTHYIEAINISVLDSQDSVVLTPDDWVKVRALKDKHGAGIVPALRNSLAPTIHGLDIQKEAALCSMVSTGSITRPDGTVLRGHIHGMFAGDPGVAKSQLKRAIKDKMPGVILASGLGSTEAGMTASAVKDKQNEGGWVIEAGALAQADGAGLIVDEFDKMRDEIKTHFNDGLEEGQFEVHKAGINVTLKCREWVIFCLNPKGERFDYDLPLASQIGIPPSLMSRFDWIFTIKDEVDEKRDAIIAERMIKGNRGEEIVMTGDISPDDLKLYLAAAKTIKPVVPAAFDTQFVNQYVRMRQKSRDGVVSITPRYVNALYRLARAEAQLCLSLEVTMEHFWRAIDLLQETITTVGTDKDGRMDADLRDGGIGKSQRDKVKIIQGIIAEISNGNGSYAPVGEIVLKASELGITDGMITYYLRMMKEQGYIIETGAQKFKNVF